MLLSLCCSVVIMFTVICVALLLFVLSYVLIVCTVPLPPGVSPIAVDKCININTNALNCIKLKGWNLRCINFKRQLKIIKNHSDMFRIVCHPSSGSVECACPKLLVIFFVCVVGVWQRNFEPVVCVPGTTSWELQFYTIECISRPIKLIDFKNARWKHEIKWN